MNKIFKIVSIFALLLAFTIAGLYFGYLFTNSTGNLLSTNISKGNVEIVEKTPLKETKSLISENKIDEEEKEEKEYTIKEDTKIIYNYKNPIDNTIVEEVKLPTKAMIGLNQEVFNKTLNEFDIVDFNENTIILEKNINFPSVYEVGNSNGYVAIFYYDDNNEKQLKQQTHTLIATLPEYDQKLINNGINVSNEIQLVSILDDYEN